uniref:Uncharacterized protein n=1 Tax=Romanomermis culicivorax TaxID=13658 RepID=A0A915IR49_ROMCU
MLQLKPFIPPPAKDVFNFEAARPKDWTPLFSLVDGEHTIIISSDGADDWAGTYALLSTQFRTNRQKKKRSHTPIYACPLPTTASAPGSTTEEQLRLDDISSPAPVPMEELTPDQPVNMETEADTATLDHMLMDIPEETTANNVTAIDLAPHAPAIDLLIYLTKPLVLPSPPIITTVAAVRYIPPVRFSQQIISDSQWNTLAAPLKAYSLPPPPSSMLFLEHHWHNYSLALQDQIKEILLPPMTPAPAAPQQMPPVPMAAIVTQLVPQWMAMQLPQMVSMDIQQLQQPSTSTTNLDRYRQPIHKPAQQEEVESRKAHSTHTMDEPHAGCRPPLSTSHTERRKTLSEWTTRRHEQWAKQKE